MGEQRCLPCKVRAVRAAAHTLHTALPDIMCAHHSSPLESAHLVRSTGLHSPLHCTGLHSLAHLHSTMVPSASPRAGTPAPPPHTPTQYLSADIPMASANAFHCTALHSDLHSASLTFSTPLYHTTHTASLGSTTRAPCPPPRARCTAARSHTTAQPHTCSLRSLPLDSSHALHSTTLTLLTPIHTTTTRTAFLGSTSCPPLRAHAPPPQDPTPPHSPTHALFVPYN